MNEKQLIAREIDKVISSLAEIRNTINELGAAAVTANEAIDALQLFTDDTTYGKSVSLKIPPMPLEEAKPKRRNIYASQGKIDIAKVRAVLEYKYSNAEIRNACEKCGIMCERVSHTFYIHYANIDTIKKYLEA